MKNQKVTDHYDKLYSNDEKAFSGEPLPLVKALTEYLPSGNVLEIGAGAGRNSIFLASEGYTVSTTDISPVSVERITKNAVEKGVVIKSVVSDVAEEGLKGEYDAIVCTFTFHHLRKEDAEKVIGLMQEHTKPNGFNVVTTFTKNGDFFKGNPDTPNFYIDGKEQLESMYAGWKIIKSFEREGKARALTAEGDPQANIFVGFLAQKD